MLRKSQKNPPAFTNTLHNFTKSYLSNNPHNQNTHQPRAIRKSELIADSARGRTTRLQLGQISNNVVYPILGDEESSISCKMASFISSQKSYYPHFRPKLKQNFTKNKQKIKKIQQYSISMNQSRPNRAITKAYQTQKSQAPQTNPFQTSLNKFTAKCNLLLQYTDNHFDKCDKSTSRALMNYSKIYRNQSRDRFKVKTDKSFITRFMELTTQKVVMSEKYKREKMQNIAKSFTMNRSCKPKCVSTSQNRYMQAQQYDIQAWDYN